MKSILSLVALFTLALPALANDPPPQSTLTPMPLAAPSAPCATGLTMAVTSYGAPAAGFAERASVRSRVREVVRSRPVRSLFHRRRGGGCG